MSRFYGDLQGNRGQATRCGHKSIQTHVSGWGLGVLTYVQPDNENNNEDKVIVSITGGSNHPHPEVIFECKRNETGKLVFKASHEFLALLAASGCVLPEITR